MNRRKFFKLAGISAAGLTEKLITSADAAGIPSTKQFIGVLNDTTKCIGCRNCEKACSEVNGMQVPDIENDNALEKERVTDEKQLSVVNKYKTDKGTVYIKRQCMHCWQPACAAACLTNALHKTEEGPIIWRSDKCMGCRYCMVSCPFDIPKFEYQSWNPRILKCDMCWKRIQQGAIPACVEACPSEALMFGLKKDLMEIARTRIYKHPKDYVSHVYGEYEVGGASWLYLSSVPFEQLGFRTDLGNTPYPEYTKEFLYAVPAIILILPPLLYGLHHITEPEDSEKK